MTDHLRVRRRLPLQHGPLPAGHGRADGQRRPPRRTGELHPPKDVADLAEEIAGRTGARITVTEDPAAGRGGGRLHPHRRVGVDGGAQGRLGRAGKGTHPLPGQRR